VASILLKSFKFSSSGSFLRAGLVFYLKIYQSKYLGNHVENIQYTSQYVPCLWQENNYVGRLRVDLEL